MANAGLDDRTETARQSRNGGKYRTNLGRAEARKRSIRKPLQPAPTNACDARSPCARSGTCLASLRPFERPRLFGQRSADPQFVESLRDPGARVLMRLEPALLQARIGVLVPDRIGEVVAEHGRRGLRLIDDAEREIGLGEPLQRLFGMAGRLIFRQNIAETVDRSRIVAVLADNSARSSCPGRRADRASLQLVARVVGIFRFREFLDDLRRRPRRPFRRGPGRA